MKSYLNTNQPWLRYVTALGIVAAAAAVRAVFLEPLGNRIAYVTFYPAVMIAALYCGLSAGILATVASALIASYFWIDPVKQLLVRDPADWLGVVVFIISCTIISCLSEVMRRSQLRAGEAETQARLVIEREQAGDLLRETAQRLELAIRAGGLGIWDWNMLTGDLAWDDRMYELYGLSRDAFGGSIAAWENRLHREDRKRLAHALKEALAGERDFDIDFRAVHSDGKQKTLKANAIVIRNPDGRPVRMIGLTYDITDHRIMEQQLLQAQKMEAIGRLAGGIAHDFNNKLTVILGYASVSQRADIEREKLHEYLEEIIKAALHSRDITRQLLAFSRNEVITPRLVDLNSQIRDTEKTLSRIIGEDIALTFVPQADLWPVKIDPAQVDQLIMNLAINARDAMPEGGKLNIETHNSTVDRQYSRVHVGVKAGDYVQVVISDTGCGMDRETLSHIFEPFFTTKGPGKGTGLGLATVYGIVSQNNGFILVSSEPNQGTTFSLFIPRMLDADMSEGGATRPMSLASGTVLLVEDDESVRAVTKQLLEISGFTVLVAASPHEALAVCDDLVVPIDCLVTDVVMPEMNGKQLSEAVRSRRPDIAVVFISGYTADVIVDHGVLEEDVIFLQKPFDAQSITDKIQAAIKAPKNRPS